MRYELRKCRYDISFDILLLEGCKNDFLLLEGVRSVRYELKSIDTKISFDILLLEGCKNDFLLLEGVRSMRCELRRRKYENFFYFITRRV